jgi:hypothetical protein
VPLAQNRATIPWVGPRTKILAPPKAQRRGHSTDDLRSWNPGVGAEAIRPARQRMAEPRGRIRLTVCPADSSPDDLSRPLPSVWPADRAPQPHGDRRNPESCRHRAMPPLLSEGLQRRAAPVDFTPPGRKPPATPTTAGLHELAITVVTSPEFAMASWRHPERDGCLLRLDVVAPVQQRLNLNHQPRYGGVPLGERG